MFLVTILASTAVTQSVPPARYRLATTTPAGWQGPAEKRQATKIFEATHYYLAGVPNSGYNSAPDLTSWIDLAKQYNPSIIIRLYDNLPYLSWEAVRNMLGSDASRYDAMWKFMEQNPSYFPGSRPAWHRFEDFVTHWRGDTVIIPKGFGAPRTVNGVNNLTFPQDAKAFEFCRVLVRTPSNSWQDMLASGAYISSAFTLPQSGGELYLGSYTPEDMARFTLISGASGGYSGLWEYCNAVDSNGAPVSWAALNVLQDTTNGLSQSGYVRWHPPADWKRCALRNTLRAFYVRFRVTTSGTAPVVAAYDTNTGTGGILRRAYITEITLSDGNYAWSWPGWDDANDTNGDGYVDDSEYANRVNPNCSARMKWQGRAPMFVYSIYNKGICQRPVMGPGSNPEATTSAYREFIKQTMLTNLTMRSAGGNTIDGVFLDNVIDGFWMFSLDEQYVRFQTYVQMQGGGQLYSDGRVWEYDGDTSTRQNLWKSDYVGTVVAIKQVLHPLNKFVLVNSWHKNQEPFVEVADYAFLEFIVNSQMNWATWLQRQRQVQRWSRLLARGVVMQFSYRLPSLLTNNQPANETLEMHQRDKILALATFLCFMSRDKEDSLYPWYGSWYGSGDITSGYWSAHTPSYWNYSTPPTPSTVAAYIPAAEYDIGLPTGIVPQGYSAPSGDWYGETTTNGVYVFQQGIDPVLANRSDVSQANKVYYIFARDFTSGAKVLVRPLPTVLGRDPQGQLTDYQYTLGDASAVDVPLGGSYRLLQADGTLSPQTYTTIRLRNGEAAVLVPATVTDGVSIQVSTSPRMDGRLMKLGDVITVQVTVTNNGPSRNVVIGPNLGGLPQGVIPNNFAYVANSMKINGTSVPDPNPSLIQKEVFIPSGGTVTLEFQIRFLR
jgi:hypothetical protein